MRPVHSLVLLGAALLLFLCAQRIHITDAASFPSAVQPQQDDLPECVSAASIPRHDTRAINSLLFELVSKSTFFSVFSVALDKPCPFWRDDNMCVIRDCTVHECDDADIPIAWRSPCPSPSSSSSSSSSPSSSSTSASTVQRKQQEHHHFVDRSLTGLAALIGPAPCMATDNTAWVTRDDDDDSVYVDLRRNPERFTGYSGASARRVWDAVYSENCFMFSTKCSSGICLPETCKEERVLYRLISGLHASISMHIAKEYLHSTSSGIIGSGSSHRRLGNWGRNVNIYRNRLQPYPERIANLRVVYAVVLRAVSKAMPILRPISSASTTATTSSADDAETRTPGAMSYTTGNDANDVLTTQYLERLFANHILHSNSGCDDDAEVNKVFDESDMFVRDQQHLLPEFRNAFRNISMIMDCVGCEKCRLWGKLQFLGLGTALRILFEPQLPNLERNDVIALFNLLYKLSTSVLLVDEMEATIQAQQAMYLKSGAFLFCVVMLAVGKTARCMSNMKKVKEKDS